MNFREQWIGISPILTLAADVRFCQPDYTNDIIWEISLTNGEPAAVALQTTLGLRARSLRLFPIFSLANQNLSDPKTFASPPCLEKIYPNYLSFHFSPFERIDILAEYWVPGSNIATGRFSLTNHRGQSETIGLDLSILLNPLGEGLAMAAVNMDLTNVLQGKTGNLVPICVLSEKSKPGAGSLPTLSINLDLQPGKTYQTRWALAALSDDQASFTLASKTLNRSWDGEIAQIERQNESQEIEIITGDPEWDAAFAFSQNIAWGLFLSPSFHLPYPSFVLSRRPDQGYSLRGDGSDYSHQWNGQNAFDSYYLSNLILPGGINMIEGLIRNFLAIQEQNGFIDWKPGLAGQRSRHLAQPLLATLALLVDSYKSDHEWLAEIYPGLLKFFQIWFQPEHDRDGDGFPEWDHPLQSGAEENPIYDRWHPQSQGADISTMECPALGAFLYRECQSLEKIAEFLEQKDALSWLIEKRGKLRKMIAETWDDEGITFRYRDFQTHLSHASIELAEIEKVGRIEFQDSKIMSLLP